jgi:hypothetical protein
MSKKQESKKAAQIKSVDSCNPAFMDAIFRRFVVKCSYTLKHYAASTEESTGCMFVIGKGRIGSITHRL